MSSDESVRTTVITAVNETNVLPLTNVQKSTLNLSHATLQVQPPQNSKPSRTTSRRASNFSVASTDSEKKLDSKTNVFEDPQSDTSDISKTLDALCKHLQSLITLGRYAADLWENYHTDMVVDFFSGARRKRIILYIEEDPETRVDKLVVQSSLSSRKINELMYFIYDPDSTGSPPPVTDFEKRVQYGTIEGSMMESFLRLMHGVYIPLFVENQKWPESVKKDFVSQLHKFMAILTV
jgi:hypothetical protein